MREIDKEMEVKIGVVFRINIIRGIRSFVSVGVTTRAVLILLFQPHKVCSHIISV